MANLIGQQRGNFKLIQLLGQGGFAEVYLGENIYAKNNKVAIKILNTHLDERGILQFRGEANTLTSLRHSHIIQVTDFGFDNNNIPYLIMEYAPNGSLANRHPLGKPLPIDTVIAYIKQVADALQHANKNNIIHRDVKPANMLIGANNSILLSDFGIARVVQTYTLGTKSIVGSFEYMSPEQGKAGAGAVFASDQYSLGVVAYQWLCGNLPFQGDSIQLMAQHRLDPPPPFPEALHLSASIENVIRKALAKDPDQRFVNVQEFAFALEQASKEKIFPVQPSPSRKVAQREKPSTQIQPSSNIDIDVLYRQGVVAYTNGNTSYNKKDFFEEAERCWEQVLATDPNYMNGSLKTRFTKLQEQLGPIRIEELRRRAENYRRAGQWQEAIQTSEALLRLKPKDTETLECIETARHNMQYTKMYAIAQQLVQEGNLSAAKAELAELKVYAPKYGDPNSLSVRIQRVESVAEAKKKTDGTLIYTILFTFLLPWCVCGVVGVLTQSFILTVSIVVAIAILSGIFFTIVLLKPHTVSNRRLIASFITVALVASGLAVFIAWKTIETQQIWGLIATLVISSVIMFLLIIIVLCHKIWFNVFLFLSAAGIASGLVTGNWVSQSWIVAIGIVVILALVAYMLGYRRAKYRISPISMIAVTLFSIAVVFTVTWYTSKLNYSYSEVSSFWFVDRRLWIGRQVNLGLIISIVPGIVVLFLLINNSLSHFDWDLYSRLDFLFVLFFGIAIVTILYLLFGGIELFLGWSLGGWGCGFGFGWYFTWLSVLPTLLMEIGILHFLETIGWY